MIFWRMGGVWRVVRLILRLSSGIETGSGCFHFDFDFDLEFGPFGVLTRMNQEVI